jgi:VCBS repeat-containing protein
VTTYTGTNGDDTINGGNGVDTIYGGDGNDIISGGNGTDTLFGEGGNDELYGDNGADDLNGGAGDDLIDGLNGFDTAYYSGAIDEYSFFSAAGYLHILHFGGAGPDGHDRVIRVERLVFADRVINIGSGKNAPVAGDDHVFINEDTGTYSSGAASVKDNDFDFDGDPLTVTGGTFTGTYGTLTLNANGTYSYTLFASAQGLDDGENVIDSFNYTVSDNDGSDTGTLVFHIAGLNDAPVANDDTASTTENAAVSGNVLANDTDVDVETLTVANPGTYVGANGTLVLAADGSYTYTPNAGAQALDDGEVVSDVFSYTASDGTASDTATLTIIVNGVNDAPVANDDTASTTEEASVSGNVLSNDTDLDVEPLTVANPGTYVGTYGTLTLAANGSYTYAPNAAAQGLDTGEVGQDVFAYTASDGTASDTATLTVNVNGLNDAPVANDDTASTNENTSVSGNVLANDTDVDVETLTVTNPGTYIGAYGTLVLAANGSYTYTPTGAAQALNAGQMVNDVFTYIASDGTASDTATLTVTVTGLGGVPHANDDTASTTEDANVSGNVLTNDTDDEFDPLTVSNPGTYAGTYGTLTLAANGSYTYAPNAAADGLAAGESAQDVFTYTATDGTGSDNATLTVTVNGANDAPTIDAGGTDASGSVTELPDGDPNEGTAVHSDSGAVAFDDLDLSDTHSASFTPQGGGYFGTFTLDPVDQPGDSVGWDFTVSDAALEGLTEGQVVTQTYTVAIDDGHGGTATQDVTITITGAGVGVGPQTVWYIDNSAVGSANLGTQADPYTSIAAFNAAQGTLGGPQVGHTVHLLAGTGTGVYAEADGINLLNGQILVGDANGAVRPTIEAAAGDGVNVAQNNDVSGLDIGNTSGADIADSGGSVGTLTISDVGTSGTGQIVDIDQGGTLNVTLNAAGSLGSAGGAIDLAGVGGSFTVTGATTITGIHSGGGIDITGSSLIATFGGGGTVSTGATTAVNFVGNTGALAIGGGFAIVTTSGAGLNATGGGTVTATGSGNSITAVSGTALNVANTNIGAADLIFESISAGSGVASAGVGISLDNTGALGGLHVTGTGVAGSGGTIQNKTGADGSTTGGIGIYLNNTSDVQLDRMALHDFDNFAVRGLNVTGFTLGNSTVSGVNGNNAATPFNEGSISFSNLLGSASIANSSISGGFADNLRVINTSGTLDRLTMTGDTIGDNNAANGNDGVTIAAQGTANVNVTVQGTIFTGARGDLFQFSAPGSGTSDLVFTGNTLSNNHAGIAPGGGGVTIGSGSTSVFTFLVANNSFRDAVGHAVLIVKDAGTGTMTGIFDSNTIGVIGVANSGSLEGAGLRLNHAGGGGTVDVDITNNQIREYNNEGIVLQAGAGITTGGTFVIEVAGNTVSNPGTNPAIGTIFQGFLLNNGVAAGDSFVTYLTLGGDAGQENIFTGSGRNGGVDYRIRARQNTDVHVTANDATGHVPAAPNATYHYTGGLTDGAALATFLAQHNSGSQAHATANTGEFRGDSPPPPASLMVAAPAPPTDITNDNILSQSDVDALVQAAIQRWSDAGATADQVATMRAVSVTVSDMAGLDVGFSEAGRIRLDDDGAGYGWFVDATPGEDSEFEGAGTQLTADAGGAAEGRIDALTVILHELGHQIGLHDDYHAGSEADLMHGYVDPGERRLPDNVFETEAAAMPAGRAEWGEMLLSHPDLPMA